MSRDYKEFTTQCIKLQNDKRIMWAYPQIKEFTPESFLDEWDAKLVVAINEYEGAKPMFYLTYAELKMIQLYIEKNVGFSKPIQHFVGAKKETFGEFAGLSYASYFSINYDKEKKCPWSVLISTGFAKALPGKQQGSFYPQSGSFKKVASAAFYTDYLTIKYFFDECIRRYEFVENIMRTKVFDAGLKGYLDRVERSTATAKASEAQVSYMQMPPVDAPSAPPAATVIENATPVQTTKRNVVPVSGLFQGTPVKRADGRGFDTKLLVKGKLYDVVIKEATPDMVRVFKDSRVAKLMSWQENDLLYVDLPS